MNVAGTIDQSWRAQHSEGDRYRGRRAGDVGGTVELGPVAQPVVEVDGRDGPGHEVALGLVAACFCFFSLAQVITMLVITRILLQFSLQHAGVMLLRAQRPELPRPFKIPLYPLPPLIAKGEYP